MRIECSALVAAGMMAVAPPAQAQQAPRSISYVHALELAEQISPSLAVARSQERVAAAQVGIAGSYANPTLTGGTSTQTAKIAASLSVPLVIFGQRGAAIRASQAELSAARVDTEIAQIDARAAAAHAFVGLWLAERTALARAEADAIAAQIDESVGARVELGAAPQLDASRAHAQHLRAHADAVEASQLIDSAAADLGRWIGVLDASNLRTEGDPEVPASAPPLTELAARIEANPVVRREQAEVRAALARADRERALVRPALVLDLGVEAYDPTLPATNYRAQLGMELPIFSQRRAYIDREERAADAARVRAQFEGSMLTADLVVAYRTFVAVSARTSALSEAVLPAVEAAARATRESYSLGRATLEAVLEAERNRIDTALSLIEAETVRDNAWIDVERAMGVK